MKILMSIILMGLAQVGSAADFQINGRMDLDLGIGENASDWGSEQRLRRLRFSIGGSLSEQLDYYIQTDISSGASNAQGFWLRYRPERGKEWRFGRVGVSTGIENISSSLYLPFMERTLASSFTPRYATGITYQRLLNEGAFTASLLRSDLDHFGSSQNFGEAVLLRLGRNSRFGKNRVYFGGSYLVRRPEQGVRFRARAETMLFRNRLLDTRRIDDANRHAQLGLELVAQRDDWTFVAEQSYARIDRSTQPALNFDGGYVQISKVFNGQRRFNFRRGRWMKPHVTPWKTHEWLLRFSHMDLSDGLFEGGHATMATAGVNLYSGEKSRFQLNLSHRFGSDRNLANPDLIPDTILQLRYQHSF